MQIDQDTALYTLEYQPSSTSTPLDRSRSKSSDSLKINEYARSSRRPALMPRTTSAERIISNIGILKRSISIGLNDISRNGAVYKPVSDVDVFYHYVIEKSMRQIRGEGKQWLHRIDGPAIAVTQQINHEDLPSRMLNLGCNIYYGEEYTAEVHALYCAALAMRYPLSDYAVADKLGDAVRVWAISLHDPSQHAFLVGSGYAANILAIPAMITPRETVVLYDDKSHNSMVVAARIGRPRKLIRYAHNDYIALEMLLRKWTDDGSAKVLVMTEGLFSMEGTVCDLPKLAELKRQFGFDLLVDECHSMMNIGGSGCGVNEYFSDTGAAFEDPVDVRTWGTGKGFGNSGGIVTCRPRFFDAMATRDVKLRAEGQEPMLLHSLVAMLLHKETRLLVRPKLARLRAMAQHVRGEFLRVGMQVYGESDIALMPIFVGTPYALVQISKTAKKQGISLPSVGPPAVHKNECRVRMTIGGAFRDEDIDLAVAEVIGLFVKQGLIAAPQHKPVAFSYSGLLLSKEAKQGIWTQAHENVWKLLRACEPAERLEVALSSDSIAHLRGVLNRFHYGAGSARWVNGTSRPHTDLEAYMQELLGVEEVMSMGETRLARLSLSRALARRVKGTVRNLHLVPVGGDCGEAYVEGQISSARSSFVQHLSYTSTHQLRQMVQAMAASQSTMLTLVLHIPYVSTDVGQWRNSADEVKSLLRWISSLIKASKGNLRATVLIDDGGFGRTGSRSLGLIDELVDDGWLNASKAMQALFSGSFFRCFKTCGAFVAGPKQLVDEMRWAAVGYMFSTTTPPLLSAVNMIKLKQISE